MTKVLFITVGFILFFGYLFAWAIPVGFVTNNPKTTKWVTIGALFVALLYAGYGIISTGKPFVL
jgi:hypothetical protein